MFANLFIESNRKPYAGTSCSDENESASSRNSKFTTGDKPYHKTEKTILLERQEQRLPLRNIQSNVQGQPVKISQEHDHSTTFIVSDENDSKESSKSGMSFVTDENKDEIHNGQESQCETTAGVRQLLSMLDLNRDNHKESPTILDSSTVRRSQVLCEDNGEVAPMYYSPQDLFEPHYAEDIYTYLREFEIRCKPNPCYMKKQRDITNGMRSVLVEWLVEVAEEFQFQTKTLYLAVAYIDRFLTYASVLRGKLQLLGTTCMFISSKYEEICPPVVEEFVFITDNTYTKKQVIRMEQMILKVLAFDLAAPTVYHFLEYCFHLGNLSEEAKNLALYLGELTLLEADPYLHFLPSVVAGSVVCLACHTLGHDYWPDSLKYFTRYCIEDFKDCLQCLLKSYVNAPNYQQQGVRKKYSSSKYLEVSNILPPLTPPT